MFVILRPVLVVFVDGVLFVKVAEHSFAGGQR